VPGDSGTDPTGEFSSVAMPITTEDPGIGIVCGCNTVNGQITGGESDKGRILVTLESELAHDEEGKRRTSALYRGLAEDDSCAKGKIFSSKMTLREINAARTNVKTLIPFVEITISKKPTTQGVELELVAVVWSEVGPTYVAKGAHVGVIRCSNKETMDERIVIKNFGWGAIYHMSSYKKRLIPIF
jgi:hypothetical protein